MTELATNKKELARTQGESEKCGHPPAGDARSPCISPGQSPSEDGKIENVKT